MRRSAHLLTLFLLAAVFSGTANGDEKPTAPLPPIVHPNQSEGQGPIEASAALNVPPSLETSTQKATASEPVTTSDTTPEESDSANSPAQNSEQPEESEPVLTPQEENSSASPEASPATSLGTLADTSAVDSVDAAKNDLTIAQPELALLDPLYLRARQAFDQRKLEKLVPLVSFLQTHELHDYPELWVLILKLRGAPEDTSLRQAFESFIERHQGEYVGERAMVEYLRIVAETLEPKTYLAWFKRLAWNQDDPELAAWQAIHSLTLGTPSQARALSAAKRLFRDSSATTRPVLRLLGDRIVALDPAWAWSRVVVLLQKGSNAETKYALDALPANERPASLKELSRILERPDAWLKRQKQLNKIPARLAVFAALRLARSNPEGAARLAEAAVDPRAARFWRALVWSRIGFTAMSRLHPQAWEWFCRAPGGAATLEQRPDITVRSEQLLAWRARAALRAGDWRSLESLIQRMPEVLRHEETWVYWRGRALQTLGQPKAAKAAFESIAPRMSFYGKLASAELDLSASFPKTPLATLPSEEAIRRWDNNPSLNRALAFYRMSLYASGHREWNWALRGLTPPELLSLAAWAQEKRILHRMINTSDRSGTSLILVNQRYPRPHFSVVSRYCAERDLPSSWVYGLIRQESRFMPTANSSVGARGLMQIMPGTARWTARRLNMPKKLDLADLETNVSLGTGYLKMLYDAFGGNYIAATAAYNAGPRRAQIWLNNIAGDEMEAAIFIETIPYFETREYVKNVLANMQNYAALDEKAAENFRTFLGTVRAEHSNRPLNLP